ncbi:hypothetical protein EHS13_07380 [Paenibacillus psychroresistens]|uniref:Uncharacterized protein n=1 Tax=Paenibacillus psychroresistens TaxID=1778678 RepID=A0A6B8REW5_9BACL|nr:glycoside hydrolase N-terminal domain-containing protein [Paenibacillus psychroresistens]QGQ94720.1 hypothetical protein EHS13_07380 [Paenibacillus psychroresistens]
MNSLEQAAKHPLIFSKPAPNFFEGGLLGNGGLGVVVTTRPDGIVLYFGHNNVWDIRVSEQNKAKIGTFQEIFDKIKDIPETYDTLYEDSWYNEYIHMAREDYVNYDCPRPMPCGSLLLAFDRRKVEVLGHRIDIATGLCEVYFLYENKKVSLQIFVESEKDAVWLRTLNELGEAIAFPFDRVRLFPDPETPQDIPAYEPYTNYEDGSLSFRQVLPYELFPKNKALGHSKDKAFRLTVKTNAAMFRKDVTVPVMKQQVQDRYYPLEAKLVSTDAFVAYVQLDEGLASGIPCEAAELLVLNNQAFEAAAAEVSANWRAYWERSGVQLEDTYLEQIWYWNLYFYNCAIKPGVTCPGLYGNWSFGKIGSMWHGDYHLNYNTQQPFWLAFSSNHVDKHLPYVDLVDHMLPISKQWAEEYYGLRGAYFPHSAYPTEMTTMPWPVPEWGWEICETPWTVQSLWWHYIYTMDQQFLEQRAFEPIKQAVLFLVDYMKRPEAHGGQWGDDKYHVFPTVVPELYELTPGFKMNYDCLLDLTLIKFIFKAFVQACSVLQKVEVESELLYEVAEVLEHFPAYPTAESQIGSVFISVPGESPETIYNVPNSVATIFPGEDHGIHSSPEEFAIAANSFHNHRNEGGNDLVFHNMAGARLGLLDLERFKRQIEYCMLPNGTCADRILLSGGRYGDQMQFDWMNTMGIWFENFSLPAVINECLMQSYNGVIRLFPNWTEQYAAEFTTLLAVGGFLVSARIEQGEVQWLELESLSGAVCKLYLPWDSGAKLVAGNGEEKFLSGKEVEWNTAAGDKFRLTRG